MPGSSFVSFFYRRTALNYLLVVQVFVYPPGGAGLRGNQQALHQAKISICTKKDDQVLNSCLPQL